MLAFILRRILQSIAVLLTVGVVAFSLFRYVGDPIAAVAAKDRKTAMEAIAAIAIASESLPPVIGLEAARQPDAPAAEQ